MSGRDVLRGLLDTLTMAVFIGLVAANTGFLPLDGFQTEASAAFGICRSDVCPESCDVWISIPTNEPPYFTYVSETCQVTAPNTQWAGFCDGICGICALGSRCGGTTVTSNVPCYCILNGC